jgi:NSS family neurotransmitter:Na+ symporter
MHQQYSAQELAMPAEGYKIWAILVKFVAPAAVFLVFLHVVGVL